MPRQRRIKPDQARRALYFDFEGRKAGDPVLLGVLFDANLDGPDSWVLKQFVFDEACSRVDEAVGSGCDAATMEEALDWLLTLSDTERRHLVSWSLYDQGVAKRLSRNRSFRYRNALATVRGWRYRERIAGRIDDDGTADNSLRHYESLIGYDRPPELHDVGDSIGYIHDRESVTAGAMERWKTILTHNEHDLLAMRDVMFTVLDLNEDH
ncbi:MAG: hypothetical protein M3094_08820 [Actinomycetia bacterium]|nr:hypothetical protein [Actinomycetes bacterium]